MATRAPAGLIRFEKAPDFAGGWLPFRHSTLQKLFNGTVSNLEILAKNRGTKNAGPLRQWLVANGQFSKKELVALDA